ncbi:MAG TPA: peptide-methionine (S)-S-oxide reductase MsrA [Acidimicrobiales bacterium]|nr:peptide-methionine (S)-S-oxide reductase MsrA [Acidimicrobiales bacterium]
MLKRAVMIGPDEALEGREEPLVVARPHLVLGTSLTEVPDGAEVASVAMGCFWGAERLFYRLEGVVTTAVGYQGGYTPNPTYREVCTGETGHAEVVRVVFDPARLSYRDVVRTFFENHDPTQGYRQGNDVGTQYRSALFVLDATQEAVAREMAAAYGERLSAAGYAGVTTEIAPAGPFYLAEEYHQQYLEANPGGYCGIAGTGVSCPVGLGAP